MVNITKSFGSVLADDQVNFELLHGEIHGLLGENGAGKTTLMNILYGLHQPDSGEIIIQGEKKEISSPHKAVEEGIGMVHQHFMQIPTLTVIDNVILGLESLNSFKLNRARARERLVQISKIYGLQVDPDACIWQLSIGDRQRVEILKALYREVKILILDEPTSVLTPQETTELFHTIRKLVDAGLSVVFITHKLEEAMSITDRVTVLRDGKVVATRKTQDTNKAELACFMVGREVLFRLKREPYEDKQKYEVLRVENLTVKSDRGSLAVRDVTFNVQSGEIVGIAGVDGNGQTELVQALTGLRHVQGGSFWVDGVNLTNASPREILEHKVGHIPEEQNDALVANFTLIENLMLNRHYTDEFSKCGILDQGKMESRSRELIRQYDVKASSEKAIARTLSGGNKQKLIVAREIARDPRLLVAAHPTRGVDIGAEESIRNLLLEKRRQGGAILLVSTKLDEVLSLSDRILVMEKGRIVGEVTREEADIEKIGLLMAGTRTTT
ncbi:MAG: ABC transporter ATP-binding protein [Anaerolineae bacterium]|nr:ABC transporter ATP-binding protein [Anaerolineae bacterium]